MFYWSAWQRVAVAIAVSLVLWLLAAWADAQVML